MCGLLTELNELLLHRLSLRRRLVLSSRHTLILSLRRPLVVSSRHLVVAFLWNYVLEKGLEEDLLPMPNFTERRIKDRAAVPPTSLAVPATMAVVVPHHPGRQMLSSGWASPSRHHCSCHCPGCCCLPSNLARLPIPVFRNLFFGPKKPFLPGFLRISFFFLRFPEEFFTGTWFWRGRRNSCFFSSLQDFFPGIPVGQEFLYLPRNPPDSGGFLFPPKAAGSGQRLNKALC